MCELFHVTPDYIRGETSRYDGAEQASEADIVVSGETLTMKNIASYVGLPIYLVFPNKDHSDGWAILSVQKNEELVAKAADNDYHLDFKNLGKSILAFPFDSHYIEIEAGRKQNCLGMSEITGTSRLVWVSMTDSDYAVKAQYDGWYKVVDNEFLQRNDGRVLPLAGLNVNYKVFVEKV